MIYTPYAMLNSTYNKLFYFSLRFTKDLEEGNLEWRVVGIEGDQAMFYAADGWLNAIS